MEIRNELLLILSENNKLVWHVIWIVVENYDILPENVRNLILNFSEKDETAWCVARIVARNFNALPEDVRNRLLLTLSEKSGIV